MNMRYLLILLLFISGAASAQFAPTSAKTAFKWGVSIGTRDSSAYAANDSLVVTINRAGRMMYRSTDGYWKLLANAASSDYVPYTGAVDNVNLGNFRLTARSIRTDSVYANSSAGMYLLTNSGSAVAHWGSGGSVEVDFKGFAGYDANRSASYTVRSFTDKNYVDSADGLRVRYTDTAAMLSNYRRTTTKITNSDLVNSTISGISLGSNLNSLTAGNGLSGTAYNGSAGQTFQVDTSVISTKANVTGALVGYTATGRFTDSIAAVRALANTKGTGTVTSVATGVGLSGGTITTSGTISADTTTLSTRAYVTGQLVGYATTGNLALKLNISDTSAMLSNYRRKTTLIENADLRNSAITINGTSTSLGGSISVGTVTSVSAGTGMNFTTITSTGAVNADTTVLGTRAFTTGGLVAKANTSLNNVNGVLSSTYGGAGSVNGILKANGSGVVSAAVAGDITSLISGTYLPLSGGTLTGSLNGTSAAFSGDISSKTATISAGNITGFAATISGSSSLAFGSTNGRRLAAIQQDIGNSHGIQIGYDNNDGTGIIASATQGAATGLDFYIFNGSNWGSALRITNARRVLVNTTTDNGTDALQVAGSGLFNLTSSGAVLTLTRDGGTNGGLTLSFPSQQATFNSTVSDINFQTLGTERLKIAASTGAATFSSSVKANGFIQSISTKTANYTLTTNDHTVIFDVSGGNRTATLPAGVEGQIYVIKIKGSANNINVNPNGSETIEGFSSWTIFGSSCGDASYTFQFLSGNWYIISSHIPDCL